MADTPMPHGFAPVNQATGKTLNLSKQKFWLTGQVLALGARLWIRHEFEAHENAPVEVIYGFMLPRDASLRRFRVSDADFTVDSELRPTGEAHKIYEESLQAGSLSTLARQYGDGLVNLTVGNIRPQEKVMVLLEILAGVELHDGGLRLRFPFTLAPSYHSRARGMEISPGRMEMELPAEEFGDVLLPQFELDATHLHQVGFCLDVQMGAGIQEIASPSHTLRVQTKDTQGSQVSLSRESDLPDRDLLLDVRTTPGGASLFGAVDTEGTARFAAVVPSTEFGQVSGDPRRLIILLDRSGSMQGQPLRQAKKAIAACLGALAAQDLFGIVAFDDQVEVFKNDLSEGTMGDRRAAQKFLEGIESRGGTELASGVEAAAKILRNEPGDILILTDGQVFGTEKILERARSTGVRIHCLGIGSASQDRFLAQLAGHTGGVSRFLAPSERVDLPAVELFASIGRPVAQGVTVTVDGARESKISPEPSHLVFSGTPLLVFGEFQGEEKVRLSLGWQGAEQKAHLELPIPRSATSLASTLKLLQGARIISDFESRYQPAERHDAATRREASRGRERLLQLSREYGLASSEMSLVAVVKRASDVAGEVPKTRIVPVGIPSELEYFRGGRARSLVTFQGVPPAAASCRAAAPLFSSLSSLFGGGKSRTKDSPRPAETKEDLLVGLAGMLEPDGGMPGKTEEARIANSLVALIYFAGEGNTSTSGPFRIHVERLRQYLNSNRVQQLSPAKAAAACAALEGLAAGEAPEGDWAPYAVMLAKKGTMNLDGSWSELWESVRA